LLEGRILTTVFDETGRPVNRVKSFNVFTQDVFYGIKTNNDFYSTKQQIKIPVIAVDKKGNALTTQNANIKIIRKHWETILQKVDGTCVMFRRKKKKLSAIKILSFVAKVLIFLMLPTNLVNTKCACLQ
jgi:uncharacterized protein YfaS (alpha-2-macroglobulin family)